MTTSTGRSSYRWPGRTTVWVCWAHSCHDGHVHAFPLVEGPVDRERKALCLHTAAPVELDSRVNGPRCLTCALGKRTLR